MKRRLELAAEQPLSKKQLIANHYGAMGAALEEALPLFSHDLITVLCEFSRHAYLHKTITFNGKVEAIAVKKNLFYAAVFDSPEFKTWSTIQSYDMRTGETFISPLAEDELIVNSMCIEDDETLWKALYVVCRMSGHVYALDSETKISQQLTWDDHKARCLMSICCNNLNRLIAIDCDDSNSVFQIDKHSGERTLLAHKQRDLIVPWCVVCDPITNDILISDCAEQHTLVLTPDAKTKKRTIGEDVLQRPQDIAFHTTGLLVVADSVGNQVCFFKTDGTFVWSFEYVGASCLCCDDDGRVFVAADSNFGIVSVFTF